MLAMRPKVRTAALKCWVARGATLGLRVLHAARDSIRRRNEALAASERQLRESEERLAMALEGGCDGIWEWHARNGQLWYSDQTLRTLGYEPGDIGASFEDWQRNIHPDDVPSTERLFFDHLGGKSQIYQSEYRVRRKDGEYAWILARGRAVERNADNWATRVVGTVLDITERKNAEARITHLARHDVLTDLPNRLHFGERLDQELSLAARQGKKIALLLGDLDGFKSVNDTLGHHTGDVVLRRIADRLGAECRAEDVLARFGGDEFVILQVGDHVQPASAMALGQRLIQAVGQSIAVERQAVEVGMSFGLVFAPDNGSDPDTLMKRADVALYRAKNAGRNTVRLYEPAMDEAAEAKRRMEADLRMALLRNQFTLVFQPIINVGSDRIVGAEALLRWRHPDRGNISPAEFIPLAEETGMISSIGDWVLRTACFEAARWPSDLSVSINMSAAQFKGPGLAEAVINALGMSGLSPPQLELEITETILMQDGPEIAATLRSLRSFGVRTALDDFGTGYSSLAYLRKFPFDRLKIDRSFIQDAYAPETARIVRAIIGLGQGLGMRITAEGVETALQRDFLRREGCDEMQGYFLGRPMAADVFRRLCGIPEIGLAATG